MNLLITGAWSSASEYIEQIKKMGHSVSFLQQESDTLPVSYDWAEGIVGNGIFLYHPIEKFRNLKFLQLTSAGFDRVPMEYVRGHGIEIHNARGVYSAPMAEFALAGVLSLYKHLNFFEANRQKCLWEKHRGLLELTGKTVCIVGCGSVGSECAKRFQAFGCKVLGIDLCPYENRAYDEMRPLESLDEVLPECDILVLTLPLTEKTRHLLSLDRLKHMKKTAVLVNIARGAVVDQQALEQHIPFLGGAVLDVFEEEPLSPASILWKQENVILTPHNSFVGENNQKRLSEVILEVLKKIG